MNEKDAKDPNRVWRVFPEGLWIQWNIAHRKEIARVIELTVQGVTLAAEKPPNLRERVQLYFPVPEGAIRIDGFVKAVQPHVEIDFVSMDRESWDGLIKLMQRLGNG
jgi:hypothetical protein